MSALVSSALAKNPSAASAPAVVPPLTKRLLNRYLLALATRPLRTKQYTAALLFFLQEVIAHNLSGEPRPELPAKDGVVRKVVPGWVLAYLRELGVGAKAIQMPLYGVFISAPMNHFFVGFFQKLFAGKTSAGAKILQIVAMQLIQSPITAVVYLTSLSLMNGARSAAQIAKVVRLGFPGVIRSMWISSPLAIAFAQRFVPQEQWVVFFNLVSFVLGTYMTTTIKKQNIRLQAQAKAKKDAEGK